MAIFKSSKPAGDAYHTHKQHNSTIPKPPVLRNGVDPKRRIRPPPQAESSKEGGGAGAGDAPVAFNANSEGSANRPSQHQPQDDLNNNQRPPGTASSASSTAKSGGSPQVSFVDELYSESQAIARNSGAPCPKTPKSSHDEIIAALTKTPPAQHRRAASTARPTHDPKSEWNSGQQRSRDSSVATAIESSPRVNTRDNQPTSQLNNNNANNTDPSPLSPRALRRSSTRGSSIGMPGRPAYQYNNDSGIMEDERDHTLRALEGAGERNEGVRIAQEDDQKTEDLFLNLAQDDSTRFISNAADRAERRKSRIATARQSMPPLSTTYTPPRRDFEYRSNLRLPSPAELPAIQPPQHRMSQAASYRSTSGPTSSQGSNPLEDLDRSRYSSGGSDGIPLTPRAVGSKREIYEVTPEDPAGQRTPSSDSGTKLPIRSHAYRRSNLSYSGPRVYNSSPLVPRTLDLADSQTPQNSAPETESSTSTTAPSTVWDELDDLKSRIKKLELTGKLPATSGAAVTPSPNERPRTATTTVTTISSSPKQQGRGSVSPNHEAPSIIPEAHPLLHEALAKAKTLLDADIYKALESSASDALNLAAMFSTSGGSVAGGSVVGGGSISERQIRRKADSMCRSLTELCLALCDGKSESQAPVSRDIMGGTSFGRRSPGEHGVGKAKPSPRAMSRLDARRSSMVSAAMPNPRLSPSEAATPTQFTEGRKGSLLLRNRRGADEMEEDDTSRFRAPSRATTDIGRTRLSPRDYASQPLPSDRSPSVLSNLPSRRHFMHSSGVPASPTISNLGARRYLDRTTDTSNVVSRLAEDRGQRKPSVSGGSFESAISRSQTMGSSLSSGLSRAGSITRNRRRTETEGSFTPSQSNRY